MYLYLIIPYLRFMRSLNNFCCVEGLNLLLFYSYLTYRDGKKFLLSGTIENIEKNFCEKIEKM